MNFNPNANEVKEQIEGILQRHFGCTATEADWNAERKRRRVNGMKARVGQWVTLAACAALAGGAAAAAPGVVSFKDAAKIKSWDA